MPFFDSVVLFVICYVAALLEAVNTFKKTYNVIPESKYIDQNTKLVTLALAPDKLFQTVYKVHALMNQNKWCLGSQKQLTQVAVVEEDAGDGKTKGYREIPTNFLQTLLHDKKGVTRWTSVEKNAAMEYIFHNPTDFKKWEEASAYIYRQVALQAVYQIVLTTVGESFKLESSPWHVKAEYADIFPFDEFSLSVFDIETHMASVLIDGESIKGYSATRLVEFLMVNMRTLRYFAAPKKKDKGKRKADEATEPTADAEDADEDPEELAEGGSGIDDTALRAPANFLFFTLVRAVREHFGFSRAASGSRALVVTTASNMSLDSEGFQVFKRTFAPIVAVEVFEEDENKKQTSTWKLQRDFENLVTGSPVGVKLMTTRFQEAESVVDNDEGLFRSCAVSAGHPGLSVLFCDPSWGVNKEKAKYGGIDLPEHAWTKCVCDDIVCVYPCSRRNCDL